ncbi:hypothetical protein BDU57DRAFT_546436 [Ampelomyces quisqualis]|uniref:Uncharacterized protein n=1 Tax=Ampelomyces quisqualis TaxID=50730 RepID=A0A6A5QX57_AMPQU|nr:hypothetical protein BDU57DRAFT_546436 [Ampelomyces quisqualis]
MEKDAETVLVVGATGNIGIAAIIGALCSDRNVLAVVRDQHSAKKVFDHVLSGHDRIKIVEADAVSDQGVQSVVDKVRAGSLPAFQHVFACVGGQYVQQDIVDTTTEELQRFMKVNFESNFYAYRATIPYLLEQKDRQCTWTTCTGSQGDIGDLALPAISQGAMFSMCYSAFKTLINTNVRFNEIYLGRRVQVDSVAEQAGSTKSSTFGRVYTNILARLEVKSCRVRVEHEMDVDQLRLERKVG